MHRRRLLLAAATSLVLGGVLGGTALAAGAAAGDLGFDVSNADCASLPDTGTFGVVAVTGDPNDGGGRPYNQNPCLAAETTWAAARTATPSLYVNTADPGPASSHWPTTQAAQRVPCQDVTSTSDSGCAYDYGWNAAADAVSRAAATVTAFNPRAVLWWLDVEAGNSWVGSTDAHAADLQGYVDRLRAEGVPSVGLYSPSQQWVDITGGFTRTTAAAYRSRWAFAPVFPMELSPTWLPGFATHDEAATGCTGQTFTGTAALLAQYPLDPHDADVQCAADSTDTVPPAASMTAPTRTTTLSTSVGTSWTGDSSVTSFDVRYRVAAATTGFGPLVVPVRWQVTTARSTTTLGAPGSTYCFSVRARDARPNLSAWSVDRCTAVPFDDRSLAASPGWTRASSTAYYGNSYSSTTQYGATLSRSGLQSSRLALVATRCSSCGAVAVYVGSSLLAKVDLHATTTTRKVVIDLPRFTLRTTSVTLKVISSGKTVQVDGLTTSRV